MSEARPEVGVGLLLVRGDKILLGKRKGSHGDGEYGGIGGHLEQMESFEDCVLRELAEEAGKKIKVKNIRFLCLVNLRKYAPKHYVDVGMVAEWVSGEPEVLEPDKLDFWDWYDLKDLPSPLFGAEVNYIVAFKTGQPYFSK